MLYFGKFEKLALFNTYLFYCRCMDVVENGSLSEFLVIDACSEFVCEFLHITSLMGLEV